MSAHNVKNFIVSRLSTREWPSSQASDPNWATDLQACLDNDNGADDIDGIKNIVKSLLFEQTIGHDAAEKYNEFIKGINRLGNDSVVMFQVFFDYVLDFEKCFLEMNKAYHDKLSTAYQHIDELYALRRAIYVGPGNQSLIEEIRNKVDSDVNGQIQGSLASATGLVAQLTNFVHQINAKQGVSGFASMLSGDDQTSKFKKDVSNSLTVLAKLQTTLENKTLQPLLDASRSAEAVDNRFRTRMIALKESIEAMTKNTSQAADSNDVDDVNDIREKMSKIEQFMVAKLREFKVKSEKSSDTFSSFSTLCNYIKNADEIDNGQSQNAWLFIYAVLLMSGLVCLAYYSYNFIPLKQFIVGVCISSIGLIGSIFYASSRKTAGLQSVRDVTSSYTLANSQQPVYFAENEYSGDSHQPGMYSSEV